MLCSEIDLRRSFFLNADEILRSVLNRNEDCDDEDNWFESSFDIDSIWTYRDLNTQNFLNVRYFSIETQKSLQIFRNAVLFTAHSDQYFRNSIDVARVIRDLILIVVEICLICDFTLMMMIIWTIWNNFFIKISRANLWSTSQNCWSWKIWVIVSVSRWIMKALRNVRDERIKVNLYQRKKFFFLSKKERSVHERLSVNDSSMIIIKKNDEYFKQSMMLKRIWSFNWCYHLLRNILWIFCAVCNLVDFFFFFRREELSIVLLVYILERERSILSSLSSSLRAESFLEISLNNKITRHLIRCK